MLHFSHGSIVKFKYRGQMLTTKKTCEAIGKVPTCKVILDLYTLQTLIKGWHLSFHQIPYRSLGSCQLVHVINYCIDNPNGETMSYYLLTCT